MKTRTFFFGMLLISFFPLCMTSCGKEELSGQQANNNISVVETSGGIMDRGVLDGNVHGMFVSLTNVSISTTATPNKSAMESNRLNIYLQSESDGIIKDGTYIYSPSRSVSPLIFQSAVVYLQNKETGNSDAFDVSDGSVVVARTGAYYTFSMNGILSNGNAFRATFGGSLSYSD